LKTNLPTLRLLALALLLCLPGCQSSQDQAECEKWASAMVEQHQEAMGPGLIDSDEYYSVAVAGCMAGKGYDRPTPPHQSATDHVPLEIEERAWRALQ
jgi:hypothetical protein